MKLSLTTVFSEHYIRRAVSKFIESRKEEDIFSELDIEIMEIIFFEFENSGWSIEFELSENAWSIKGYSFHECHKSFLFLLDRYVFELQEGSNGYNKICMKDFFLHMIEDGDKEYVEDLLEKFNVNGSVEISRW